MSPFFPPTQIFVKMKESIAMRNMPLTFYKCCPLHEDGDVIDRWLDVSPLRINPCLAPEKSQNIGWWYTYPTEKYESQLG